MSNYPISIYTHWKSGTKAEDRFSSKKLGNGYMYAGVYDGHNGASAATWCAENMPKLLDYYFEGRNSTINALNNAFLDAHHAITDDSGATASILIAHGSYVAIAHVGDSRVVLCHNNKAVTLTEDHRLQWEPEKHRIEEAERADQKHYIFRDRVNGLMLTRSIGDCNVCAAVSANPVIHEFVRSGKDQYLIIATDGFWDICDGPKAIEQVSKCKLQNAEEIAQLLVNFAVSEYRSRRIKPDDITCTVVYLQDEQYNCDCSGWSFQSEMQKEFMAEEN